VAGTGKAVMGGSEIDVTWSISALSGVGEERVGTSWSIARSS
jgi:hypothetical protein